jgi:hypothetical protein
MILNQENVIYVYVHFLTQELIILPHLNIKTVALEIIKFINMITDCLFSPNIYYSNTRLEQTSSDHRKIRYDRNSYTCLHIIGGGLNRKFVVLVSLYLSFAVIVF